MVATSMRALRQAAMDRLAQLDTSDALSSDHVRLTSQTLGVAERTVWRWLAARRAKSVPAQRRRFRINDRLRVRLAYWRGNAAAVHRELVTEAEHGGPPAPDLRTVQRAIKRDLTAGELAGLRGGERERRKFDVFLQRPASFAERGVGGRPRRGCRAGRGRGATGQAVGDLVRRRRARCDPRCGGRTADAEPREHPHGVAGVDRAQ